MELTGAYITNLNIERNCPFDHRPLVIKKGRYGKYWACSNNQCSYQQAVISQTNLMSYSDTPWINASDIGQVTFCPNSLTLSLAGVRPSKASKIRMKSGRYEHARLNKAAVSQSRANDSRCFISTYAFGPTHDVTERLRTWRDSKLRNHYMGRKFIEFYYFVSPHLVQAMRPIPCTKIISQKIIKIFMKVFRV